MRIISTYLDQAVTSYYNYKALYEEMDMMETFEAFNTDDTSRREALFTSIFVLENRMQTACERIQTRITMKQWLLLTSASCFSEPPTLTDVGKLMGCSRQNVKKLALALEEKGFIRLIPGSNNSIHIELTDEVRKYSSEVGERQKKTLGLLFSSFSEDEVITLFSLFSKLYSGVESVEEYAESLGKI